MGKYTSALGAGRTTFRPHVGTFEDVAIALIGDQVRRRINPSQTYYSRPTVTSTFTSLAIELADWATVGQLRDSGVNVPSCHTLEQAEGIIRNAGYANALSDARWRHERIAQMTDEELRDYDHHLRFGDRKESDRILEKVS